MVTKTDITSYSISGGALRVRDLPVGQRPRELFERVGAANVPDDVLLALILRSGVRGTSVIDLARGLLQEYGSLTALSQLSVAELSASKGMGKVKSQVLKAALELATRLADEITPERELVCTPEQAVSILREKARAYEGEVFWALLLDAKNRMKRAPVEISRGLLDASLVHPREVFREAIRTSCAAIVLAHNHPSGDPSPSAEDIRITRQIVKAGRIINIDVLDHVILGRRRNNQDVDFVSLREAGLVDFGE